MARVKPPQRARRDHHIQPSFTVWAEDEMTHLYKTRESTLQTGARYRLYAVAATMKPAGTLPVDDEQLAQWAGLTADEWASMKPVLTSYWELDARRNLYVIRRIAAASRRARELSASNREAAEKRWSQDKHKKDKGLHARASITGPSVDASAMPPNSYPNSESVSESESGDTYVSPSESGEGASAPSPSDSPGHAPESPARSHPRSRAPARPPTPPRGRTAVPEHPAVLVYAQVVGEVPVPGLWGRIADAVGDSQEAILRWQAHVAWWCAQGFNPGNLIGILERWEIGDGPEEVPRNGKNGGQPTATDQANHNRIADLIAQVSQAKALEG